MFVCTGVYMSVWVYTGEVSAKRLRERYLGAILRQDIAFFDHVGAGEVATRIETDTREFAFHNIYIHCVDNFGRLGTTRHFRESGIGRQLFVRLRHWLHLGLCEALATRPCVILNSACNHFFLGIQQ